MLAGEWIVGEMATWRKEEGLGGSVFWVFKAHGTPHGFTINDKPLSYGRFNCLLGCRDSQPISYS